MKSSETSHSESRHLESTDQDIPDLHVGNNKNSNSIVLKFPFTIDGADRASHFETTIERIQNHISFALPFDLDLQIDNAVLQNKEFDKGWVVYVFEFTDLDSAIEWVAERHAAVELKPKNGDLHKIQKKMDDFMLLYEEGERKKRKKRMMIDDEGFTYYE